MIAVGAHSPALHVAEHDALKQFPKKFKKIFIASMTKFTCRMLLKGVTPIPARLNVVFFYFFYFGMCQTCSDEDCVLGLEDAAGWGAERTLDLDLELRNMFTVRIHW